MPLQQIDRMVPPPALFDGLDLEKPGDRSAFQARVRLHFQSAPLPELRKLAGKARNASLRTVAEAIGDRWIAERRARG